MAANNKTRRLGLTGNARSPGSIANMQHHDPSASEKSINGSAAQTSSVIATSTSETVLQDDTMLRVVNTDSATRFIYIGEGPSPATPDASNSLALPAGHVEVFFCGISLDETKSIVVKTSNAAVQVAILK